MLDSIISFIAFQNELHPSYSPRGPKEVLFFNCRNCLVSFRIHISNITDVTQFDAVTIHFDAQVPLLWQLGTPSNPFPKLLSTRIVLNTFLAF